ncbi:ABC transporter permease subunit [Salimicrobium halophilum]|uniref:Peptide/nickel transport system permease protein n=1 Tax=Salimicrobium halophilum TaxID=86666 RepID=A0A1G8T3A7_9BACI|nr:ABC transporter permease subunit [Salimicrobium halophilum]SDJ36048.1 peptide/nickel transport system permease protein [Salimicrobium halophilum]
MNKKFWLQPRFLISSLFLVVMVTASFIHAWFFDSHIPQTPFINLGENVVGPPFPPFEYSILGTDSNGVHLFYQILQGAKYTILGALAIAGISFSLALLIGIPLGFNRRGTSKWVEHTISVLYFVPASIIAYQLLNPLMREQLSGFATSLTYRLVAEVLVIAILLTPPATVLIANLTGEFLKKDYVISSRLIGSGAWRITRQQLFPYLKNHILDLFSRQTIQAVLVMTHLAVFVVYFGGTGIGFGMGGGPPFPVTNEWASLIGMKYYTIQTSAPWLVLVPLIFLLLFLLSVMGITGSIKRHGNVDSSVKEEEQEPPQELDRPFERVSGDQ